MKTLIFLLLKASLATSLSNNDQKSLYLTPGIQDTEKTKRISIPMKSYKDLQFFGTVFIGSQKQPLDFVFDTSSVAIWTASPTCKKCKSNGMKPFDWNASTSYEQGGGKQHSIRYGKGAQVFGFHAKEKLCIDQTNAKHCVNLSLMTIEESTGLDALYADGIIGLAPSPQRTGKMLFVDELYQQGVIQKRIFSLSLVTNQHNQKKSEVRFGSYSQENQSNAVTWHSILDPYFWSVKLISASVNGQSISISTKTAVLDSGSSNIIMPEQDFNQFVHLLKLKLTCSYSEQNRSIYQCNCDSTADFPDLKIQINKYIYTVSNYVEKGSNNECTLKVNPHKFEEGKEFWILGTTFIANYQTIFDMDEMRVGFVNPKIEYGRVPFSINDAVKIFVVIGCAVILVTMFCTLIPLQNLSKSRLNRQGSSTVNNYDVATNSYLN